jgi:putative transposase
MYNLTPIELSEKTKNILEKIARQAKCPQNLAKRAKIILMSAEDINNSEIARNLTTDRELVRRWRNRWILKSSKLKEAEEQNLTDKEITKIIIEILSDEFRPGAPATFTPEEIVQIVGIALEKPENSGLPITNWSETEIAKEAVKRNIVKSISQRSVGRFLKMRQR